MADDAPTTPTDGWSVISLKDELTGELSYLFTFPVGDGTTGSLELGNELSTNEMVRGLKRRTRVLARSGADKFILKLIEAAPTASVIKPHQPGWRTSPTSPDLNFTAYVTPGQIIGQGGSSFRWLQPSGNRPHIGQSAGNVDAWFASIGSLAEKSNYIAFAIMQALAAPLLPFVELPEDPAFNFVGPSSAGKTTAAKAGASVVGHPEAIRSWDFSERGLEEAAAAHNHCLMILNAAEKVTPKKRRAVLNRVVHMVAERESTKRSDFVQDRLPDLRWQTMLLSISNKTGAQMAEELKMSWEEQDAVRFIDIPVPPSAEGGIFDRLGDGVSKQEAGTQLIKDLEKALKKNHGLLIKPWIEYLLKVNSRREVTKYVQRFCKITGPHEGLEDRIARKFGLVYAAGKMAKDAGILPWPGALPLIATRDLLRQAKELRQQGDVTLGAAISQVTKALENPALVHTATLGKPLKISEGHRFLGVRFRQSGRELVGLRKDGMVTLLGRTMADRVVERLGELGVLMKGHGGKATQQVPITLKIGDQILSKPRFFVVDPTRFTT